MAKGVEVDLFKPWILKVIGDSSSLFHETLAYGVGVCVENIIFYFR